MRSANTRCVFAAAAAESTGVAGAAVQQAHRFAAGLPVRAFGRTGAPLGRQTERGMRHCRRRRRQKSKLTFRRNLIFAKRKQSSPALNQIQLSRTRLNSVERTRSSTYSHQTYLHTDKFRERVYYLLWMAVCGTPLESSSLASAPVIKLELVLARRESES